MSRSYEPITVFSDYPEVVAAHSLRDTSRPAENSMLPFNTDIQTALSNQRLFASELGFSKLAAPKLTHEDVIYEYDDNYSFESRPEADAIMTNKFGVLIGIGVADCIVILMYDPTNKAMAAVHTGWRGSAANIAGKVVARMRERYGTKSENIIAYLSPSPDRKEYGVANETAALFDAKYSSPKSENDKWFENKAVVKDQLLEAGVLDTNITVDPRSNFAPEFHSFRRDREKSGRHLVVIGLKT